ncbi:MAG: TonB-dependent receptor [Prolixibacteraceae bacterium]|nr:TonB-dependent receptor [Prolixibacteraceae bacterium]
MKIFGVNLIRHLPSSTSFNFGMLLLCFLMIGSTVFAQEPVKITGTVTNSSGEALTGVTVVAKGTINGSITDINGRYTLSNVPADGILVYSFIGMKTLEVPVQARTQISVSLEESNISLDEIIAVGYGTTKKSSVTGAISQVKAEDMENRTITRPEQALQGKTAGVQIYQSSASPGASPTVRVRGISSNGSNDPLFVVDGRIAGNIGGIDPNDIESMEVLKDAASAAIYGSAAGNGVILITTKKGKAGQGKISYDFQLSSQSISRVPQILGSQEYINYMTEAKYLSMEMIENNWDRETNTDWSKVAFENSFMKKHNLAFQGGTKEGSYYLSLSYLDNNGYVVGDADVYSRMTTTINADYNIKPWLQVGTNNQIEYYTRQAVAEGSEYGSLLMSVLQLDPLTPSVYAPDELPGHMQILLDKGYTLLKDEEGNYYSTSAYQETDQYHPLIMRDKTFSESKGFNVNGVIYANLKPSEFLTFTSRFAYRLSASNSYTVNNDYYVNTTMNQEYMSVNASIYTPIYMQWENFANYQQKFGNHSISGMLGTSFIQNRNFGITGNITGGKDDFGFIKDDPLYAYFAYATATAIKTVSGGEETFTRKLSYFGRASYDYANRYIAQLSLRADATDTSVLPVETRWGYFPAASLGWVISNESFMEPVPLVSYLKFRVSWGQNGTTASLGSYSYSTSIKSSGSYPFTNSMVYTVGSSPSATGNKELKWETSEQTNIGIDARFLSDRFSLTADYYHKETKDLIMMGITPSTIVGNTASPVNAGNVLNKGFELELGWKEKLGDFTYNIRGNMATLKNEVTYIHESLDRINGVNFHTSQGITVFEKGYPAWYFRGYHLEGIDDATGDPLFADLNDDGIINDSDKAYIGSGIPDFTYGLTLSASYKGMDLTVFGTGAYGNEIFSCTNRGDRLQANILEEFYNDRWTAENTTASRPRAGATDIDKYWVSDAVVFDGSYFRIKQMQLGYSLPTHMIKIAGIQHMRIYCSLDDFFTFTAYPGFDPEVTGSGNAMGVDKGYYPSSRKVVFGVNVTF